MKPREPSEICVVSDVRGHLQIALGVAARWQAVLGVEFEAVLLCGDVHGNDALLANNKRWNEESGRSPRSRRLS